MVWYVFHVLVDAVSLMFLLGLSMVLALFSVVVLLFCFCFLSFVFVLFSIVFFASQLLPIGFVYCFVDGAGFVFHDFVYGFNLFSLCCLVFHCFGYCFDQFVHGLSMVLAPFFIVVHGFGLFSLFCLVFHCFVYCFSWLLHCACSLNTF